MKNRRFGSMVNVNEGGEHRRKPWHFLTRHSSSKNTDKGGVQLLGRRQESSRASLVAQDENVFVEGPRGGAQWEILVRPCSSGNSAPDRSFSAQSSTQAGASSDTRASSEHTRSDAMIVSCPAAHPLVQAPSNPPPAVPTLIASNGAFFPKRVVDVGANSSASSLLSAKNSLNASQAKPMAPPKPPQLPSANGDDKENVQVEHKKHKYPHVKLNGTVGFASLPYQVVRRCQSKGFQFNLLCVGETGTGKTTLIESLFGITLSEFKSCDNELNTVELKTKECEITEADVNVKLRVVETAGFGDQLDKEKSAKVIVDFINDQFEARLKDELMVKRNLSAFDDKRIHACLYFISPTGHGLKALDVVTMRELSKRVNVIPVIAKSDTTSKDELARFKAKILSELRSHAIDIYQFPTDDEAVAEQNRRMNSFMPFAVVGSVDFVTKEDGTVVRARRYPWGMVEVENKEHCDFVYLRESLLRVNVDSLRERTQDVLYENYRRDRLRELKMRDGDAGPNMETACELRHKEFEEELRRRDEQFNLDFVKRVEDKEADIKRREELLKIRRRDVEAKYNAEKTSVDQQIAQLHEERARLEGRCSGRDSSKKSRK